MKAFARLLAQPGFLVLVFCLAVILFNWPLLSIATPHRGGGLYFYLFGAWGGIIAIIGLVAAAQRRGRRETGAGTDRTKPEDSSPNGQQG